MFPVINEFLSSSKIRFSSSGIHSCIFSRSDYKESRFCSILFIIYSKVNASAFVPLNSSDNIAFMNFAMIAPYFLCLSCWLKNELFWWSLSVSKLLWVSSSRSLTAINRLFLERCVLLLLTYSSLTESFLLSSSFADY